MGKRVGKVRGVLSALNPRRLHSRYRRAQLESPEDRFWLLYAQSDWDACNMHLEVRFDHSRSAHVKETLRARVSALLMTTDQSADLLRETGVFKDGRWGFVVERSLTLADLSVPRRGIWFDFDRPDRIRVTWNHIQVDGVALWRVMRLLFDENEPLLTYRRARRPVVMIPELRAIPSTLRKLGWKRTLTAGKPDVVHHAFNQWSASNVRRIKGQLDAHSATADTRLRQVGGWSVGATLGLAVRVTDTLVFEGGFAEDLPPGSAPDIAFLFALRGAL